MVKGFGAIPTPVEVAELPTALMTGVVVGQENPLTMIAANNLNEVQSHISMTGHMRAVLAVFINEEVWQGLTEEQRTAITKVLDDEAKKSLQMAQEGEAKLVEELKGRGMTIITEADGLDLERLPREGRRPDRAGLPELHAADRADPGGEVAADGRGGAAPAILAPSSADRERGSIRQETDMRIAERILTAFVVVVMAGLVLVPTAQVIMRGVFVLPFIGAEEFTRFLLICLVFCAYPLVVENGENIVMGEFKAAMPGRSAPHRQPHDLDLRGRASTGFIAYVTATNISRNLTNATPTLGIPFWIFLGATLFGFAGAALVHLLHLRKPPQADTNIAV